MKSIAMATYNMTYGEEGEAVTWRQYLHNNYQMYNGMKSKRSRNNVAKIGCNGCNNAYQWLKIA
jgi:hypothetical protein